MYKEKNKPKLILQNIEKIKRYVDATDEKDKINNTPLVIDSDKNLENKERNSGKSLINKSVLEKSNIFSSMINNLKQETLSADIDDDGNVNVGLDSKKIHSLLKKYRIDDPIIVNNVNSAIKTAINEKGPDSLNSIELENLVLKTINYTFHQTDKLNDEYIKNPDKLISKAVNIQNYKVALEMPKNDKNILDPQDIIDLEYTTGTWRVKYEFEDLIHFNVKKLFETLETSPNNSIRVKKIDYDIIDDDLNRIMKFTITLQNSKGQGFQEPYEVTLNIPSLVNDRYFKLNGTSYIPSTQHFMKPLTKTNSNEVRFLTNFSMITMSVRNLKFSISEIRDLIQYIKVNYRSLIKNDENDIIEFSDGSKIFLTGENIYSDEYTNVIQDLETNKLIDLYNDKNEINLGRSEYLYEVILNKVQKINPDDKFTKTKKSIPYIRVYISGKNLPLIIYMWSQMGLMGSLNKFGIEYDIVDNLKDVNTKYFIQLKDGKYIVILPKNIKETLICNGLLFKPIKEKFSNTESSDEINNIIEYNCGVKSVHGIQTVTNDCIDPITYDLLVNDNYPTNLPGILSGPALDMLLNGKTGNLSDLNLYRSRISEVCLYLMYKQIKKAHLNFSDRVNNYNRPIDKLILNENDIINKLVVDSGVLNYTQNVNPVDELFLSSKTIKTGPGGVPSMRAFKTEHRNVNETQIGTLSALTTSEDSNVGVVVAHTITPAITDQYGSYGYKDSATLSGWETVSVMEGMIPFINEMDSDRGIMATFSIKGHIYSNIY
jgi:hypothetical protein